MSDASRILAAILLIAVPTVEFGGLALLGMLTRRTPGYLDNPLRQNMFRAGHAHAGVWLVFALVALLWVDQTRRRHPQQRSTPGPAVRSLESTPPHRWNSSPRRRAESR
jgi:hypothetical protein